MSPSILPRHRSIVAVDIEAYTMRTNPARAQLRRVMYRLVEEALRASGITEECHDPLIDRGDGALILIHPVDQVPKTLLLNTFVPALGELLADHATRRPDQEFRMRTAVHAGEIHYDSRGPFGEAIDVACRLLDATDLKTRLTQAAAPLVMVVSDDIYRSVVRHGYDGIDDEAFEPLVHLEIGGQPHRGWVSVPAEDVPVIDVYPRHEPLFRVRLTNRKHRVLIPGEITEPMHSPRTPHITGDATIDTLLHRTGQELDARSTVRSIDPATLLDQIIPDDPK